MKTRVILLTIMLGSVLMGLPVMSYSATVERSNPFATEGGNKPQISITFGQPRRRRWRRNGRWYRGYRNYGQFRRMQVGNRRYRYRTFPEYYWDDGIRRVRYVRYYYYY